MDAISIGNRISHFAFKRHKRFPPTKTNNSLEYVESYGLQLPNTNGERNGINAHTKGTCLIKREERRRVCGGGWYISNMDTIASRRPGPQR